MKLIIHGGFFSESKTNPEMKYAKQAGTAGDCAIWAINIFKPIMPLRPWFIR